MAVKNIAIIFYIVFVNTRIMANQAEVDILNYPPYLEFTGSNPIPERLLQEIFAAALGLTVDTRSELPQEWNGMLLNNPFNSAEAVVVIYIEGIQSIGGVKILQKYPMTLDKNDPDLYWELEQKIRSHSPYPDNIIVKYCLTNSTEQSFDRLLRRISIPKLKISVYSLNRDEEVDYKFIREIEMMKTIAAKIQSGAVTANNIIDFYSFRFCTLGDLLRMYPESSPQMEEAKKMISEVVQDLTKAFVKAYQSSVLVAVVATEDKMNTRRTVRDYLRKSLAQSNNFKFFQKINQSNIGGRRVEDFGWGPDQMIALTDNGTDTNVTNTTDTNTTSDNPTTTPPPSSVSTDHGKKEGNEEDAPMFHIFLWTGVALLASVHAIVTVFMNLDPGKDTVVYRMTDPRIKRD